MFRGAGVLDDDYGDDTYWADDALVFELWSPRVESKRMAKRSTPHFNDMMRARGGMGMTGPTQPTRPAMPAAAKAPPKAAPTRKPPAAPAPPGW